LGGGGDINIGATPTAHEPEPSLARTSFMLHTHRVEALKAHTSSDNTTIPALHKCHDRKDSTDKVP
jgi:hypothetical protein